MKTTLKIVRKKVLPLFLCLALTVSVTACGSGLVSKVEPEPEKQETVSINDVINITRGKVKTQEKKAVDFSTERFQVEGINAFYILPGLENVPDAMASFDVLDYNSRGEFVYYYVTPCYITPEKLEDYNGKEKLGKVKDRSTVTEPEGRRDDYEYDAEVLMSYNPDTGDYRVIYAHAYKIDKEMEFDPETEGRPYYYAFEADDNDSVYAAFITQRAFACKVAGREEYLLLDQGGFTGRVYDRLGNIVSSMTYKTTLNNEVIKKRDQLENIKNNDKEYDNGIDSDEMGKLNIWREENGRTAGESNKKNEEMNAIVTGIAMTEAYETYLGITFFMGSELFDPETVQLSTTYMIYRQTLNEEDGGKPFISVNNNYEKQVEQWMSLNNKFFTSHEEFDNTVGYSMTAMKTGENGDEYKDQFTPFIAGGDGGDASVLIELPDFRTMPGKWIDKYAATALIRSYSDIQSWEADTLVDYVLHYEGGIEWNPDHDYVFDNMFSYQKIMTERGKKILQNIIADSILRGIGKDSDLADYIEKLNDRGWIPVPGDYKEDGGSGYNEIPSGFYKSGLVDDGFGIGLSRVSDHILSVVSGNSAYKTYIAPVDYFPDRKDAARRYIGEIKKYEPDQSDYYRGVIMEPYKMSDSLSRTTYIYDLNEADMQKKEIIDHEDLSEEALDAIDEITTLLRTFGEELEKVKMGWFLNELINNDMDEVLDEILEEAEDAYDNDKINDEEYDEVLDFYERMGEDLDSRNPDDVLDKIREDAEKKHDDGELTDKEYKDILKILDKTEEKEEDLSDEEREVLEKLFAGSRLISDVKNAADKARESGMQDILERVNELSLAIPEEIREGMLYLCAGFSINMETLEEYPVSYKVKFPEGAAVTVKENGQAETVGGKIDSFHDGVLVAAESTGERYNGNSFLVGYKGVGDMDLFSPYSYGKPMDVTALEYYDGKDVRTIVVLMTDKGLRFFEKGEEITEYTTYSLSTLEKMLGKDNAVIVDKIYQRGEGVSSITMDSYAGIAAPAGIGVSAPEEFRGTGTSMEMDQDLKDEFKRQSGIHNVYSPLTLGDRGKEAYKAAEAEGGLQESVQEKDFDGFMTYKMLLTSSGYTRDAENRLSEAIEEGLDEISASENTTPKEETDVPKLTEENSLDTSNLKVDLNERFTGHLNSAKNIAMISKDKALICSMAGGTKILDLNFGTVADDMTGSYYRAFQRGNSTTFKLLGFEDNEYDYLDNDIAMSKVYTYDYSTAELDKSVIDAFLKMIKQYAEDYLYREFRTVLNEDNEFERKEQTEEEKEESIEAGKIFDPSNKSYDGALKALEKKYGIERTPKEVKEYVDGLRKRITAVRPAITRIYELAGAKKLAGNAAGRSDAYYKNLESRMTMAVEKDSLYDILVEIRMLDDVLPELSSEQANKYRSYKPVLDYSKENGKATKDELFRNENRSEEEVQNDRVKSEYRQDVLNDIINDYVEKTGKPSLNDDEAELTGPEKKELFDNYVRSLLDQVNPENYALDDDRTVDEFIDIINHGKEILSGVRLEEMDTRIRQELPSMDAVWKLEEMIIKEKVEHESSYSSYKDWLKSYNERVELGESEDLNIKVPGSGDANGTVKDPSKTSLTGKDRISYLRTSPAYKAVIGDLKNDTIVKGFLSGRKETWDDYCKYVIEKAGAGVIKDENGFVEGSGVSEGLKEAFDEENTDKKDKK